MFLIQMTFIFTVLFFEKFNMAYKNDKVLNMCLFFTVLILHWQCLPEARNGIYMMKYALTRPEAFTHPVTVFFLGFVQLSAVWLTEICNVLKSIDQKKPQDVIVRFVGFSLILNVPKLMIGSLEQFDIQKSVSKLQLTKGRKEAVSEEGHSTRLPCAPILNFIYCVWKLFFNSLYFYFFPFVVIFIPLFQLTYLANVK